MPSDDPSAPQGDRPFPALDHLRWSARPRLKRPVLIVAFEGWNDAGDAASTAVRHLAGQWHAKPFASIDPEIFYDFSITRPQVHLDDHGGREIVWPENQLSSATVDSDLDVITLIGTEPQLRWRTFGEQITGLAQLFDVRFVLTVGSLLTDVPHTRPTPVYGASHDEAVTRELSLVPSRYEGPTGMLGVLHAACADAGLQSASLWAAVPTYVPTTSSPKAALALVNRTVELLETTVDTGELTAETHAYEVQITELVDADDESRDYVHQLEASYDDGGDDLPDDSGNLVEEVERFLRDRGA